MRQRFPELLAATKYPNFIEDEGYYLGTGRRIQKRVR